MKYKKIPLLCAFCIQSQLIEYKRKRHKKFRCFLNLSECKFTEQEKIDIKIRLDDNGFDIK